jgi:hypothetical protein
MKRLAYPKSGRFSIAFGVCAMRRRRFLSLKFEKNISAHKAKLEAVRAELNAHLAFLKKARPQIALVRKEIRQIDAEAAN